MSKRPFRRTRPLVLALAVSAALAASPAIPNTRLDVTDRSGSPLPDGSVVVLNCNDSGAGSLRDAYENAVDGAHIDLSQLTCGTITLTSGALVDPPAASTVTIEGRDKYSTVIDGGHADRVFVHSGDGALTLNDLAVRNGSYHGAYGGGCISSAGHVYGFDLMVSGCSLSASGGSHAYGGGIYAEGEIDLIGSVVTGNSAHSDAANAAGGGIWANAAEVYLSTVSHNTVSGDGTHLANGGGILSLTQFQMKYSTVSDNEAIDGAGIYLIGATSEFMTIVDSTISGNRAGGAGGGIHAKYAPLVIANSTVATNASYFPFGAGLYTESATALQSTIVADNTSSDGLQASDISGPSTASISGANNLVIASTLPLPGDTISAEPMLGPLEDNGGVTMTHALLRGSPAIDHGNDNRGAAYDQRFYDAALGGPIERVVGPSADIGAFEYGSPDRIFVDGFEGPPATTLASAISY